MTSAHRAGSPAWHPYFAGNRTVVSPTQARAQGPAWTGLPPCPSQVDAGWEQAAGLQWPSAKGHRQHWCTGPVAGAARRSPPLTNSVPAAGCSGLSEPPGPAWGQVRAQGDLWPSGTRGRVGGGCGSARRLALPPEPAAVEGVLNDSSVYWWPWSQWEAALPPGGSSRQTGVHSLKGPSSQPLWAASPAPGRRGTCFPSHCLPTAGRGSPPLSLGKQPGPAPPEGLPWAG